MRVRGGGWSSAADTSSGELMMKAIGTIVGQMCMWSGVAVMGLVCPHRALRLCAGMQGRQLTVH